MTSCHEFNKKDLSPLVNPIRRRTVHSRQIEIIENGNFKYFFVFGLELTILFVIPQQFSSIKLLPYSLLKPGHELRLRPLFNSKTKVLFPKNKHH